jgi:hypothetical protein
LFFVAQVGSGDDQKVLEVHSAFLIAASPYFAALLANRDHKEKKFGITIPDMTYLSVLRVVRYIYTGELKFVGAESLVQVRLVDGEGIPYY